MGSTQSRPSPPMWTRQDTSRYMQLYTIAPNDQKDRILLENLNIALDVARKLVETIRNDPVVRKNTRAAIMKLMMIGGGGPGDLLKGIDLSEISKMMMAAKDAGLGGIGDIVAKAEPEVALIDAITRIITGIIDASGRFIAAATPFLQTLSPEIKRELMRNLFVQCQILYEWWKDQERLTYEPIFTLFDAYGPVVKELAEIQRKMIANPDFAAEYGGKWIDVAVDLYAKTHSAMNKIRKIRGSGGGTENVGEMFAAKYALMIVFVIFLTILVIWVWRGEYQKNEISSQLDKMLLGSAFVGFFLTMI